jgi:tetratricopeptide repeat protein 21B
MEPYNAELFFTLAQPFVRLAGRKEVILERAAMLVNRACDINPSKSEYRSELGYIYFLLGW